MPPTEIVWVVLLLIIIAASGVAIRVAYLQGVCDGIVNEMKRGKTMDAEADKTLLSDIQAGQRMASHHFSLQLHCSRQGDTPLDLWDFEKMQPQPGWKYVGWCPAASTVIPTSNWGKDYPIAVMVENAREEQVWCHVPATPELVAAGFSWGR